MSDHPNDRPPCLMTDHQDERPPWSDTTLMRDYPDERQSWWETTLIRDHLDDRPPRWQTTLMRPPWRETLSRGFSPRIWRFFVRWSLFWYNTGCIHSFVFAHQECDLWWELRWFTVSQLAGRGVFMSHIHSSRNIIECEHSVIQSAMLVQGEPISSPWTRGILTRYVCQNKYYWTWALILDSLAATGRGACRS